MIEKLRDAPVMKNNITETIYKILTKKIGNVYINTKTFRNAKGWQGCTEEEAFEKGEDLDYMVVVSSLGTSTILLSEIDSTLRELLVNNNVKKAQEYIERVYKISITAKTARDSLEAANQAISEKKKRIEQIIKGEKPYISPFK